MKNKIKDSIVVGFALFSMFFGAGNLIFPPTLGNKLGDQIFIRYHRICSNRCWTTSTCYIACSKRKWYF